MESSTDLQIFEQVKKANKILIALPEKLTADALSSGLGLKLFLAKLKKDVQLACSGEIANELKFLPGVLDVKNTLPSGKSLVVMLDTSVKQLEELSYETSETKASIFLKAKEGQFTPEDITFGKEKAPFDLIIILDCLSLSSLGKIFEQNSDVFYESAKINIDHKAGNELFGAINLVDLAATSTGEILASLFEKFEQQLVDEDIATCLLTGIISKTESFQHVKTTPRAFVQASQLIAFGGRQQEIVKALYKTKPLNFLKLWGRALAKLKIDEPNSFLYSILNIADFEKSESGYDVLPLVAKELTDSLSGYKLVGVLAEGASFIEIIIAIRQQFAADDLNQKLGGVFETLDQGSSSYKILRAKFTGLPLADAEAKFLELAKAI